MLKPPVVFELAGIPQKFRGFTILEVFRCSLASLYLWVIHHHNPKSPSKNWGNICFATFTFSFQIIQQDVRNNNKKSHRFSGKKKTRKHRNTIAINPKKKAFLLLFSKKKKNKKKSNIIGNTRLKKQSVGTFFHGFHLVFSRFLLLGEELLSFVVLRTLHALPPKSGSPTWGNHWMIIFPTEVFATR